MEISSTQGKGEFKTYNFTRKEGADLEALAKQMHAFGKDDEFEAFSSTIPGKSKEEFRIALNNEKNRNSVPFEFAEATSK